MTEADLLTKVYYAFGLFVLGGLDLGTPTGGPLFGRILLWAAYFAAPIWTASAVFEAILNALRPPVWRVKSIKNKIVIIGSGELAIGFLNRIKAAGNTHRVIVIVVESPSIPTWTRCDPIVVSGYSSSPATRCIA